MSNKKRGRGGLTLVGGGKKETAVEPTPPESVAVIKLDKIRPRVRELENLYTRKVDASQSFNDAASAAATLAGLDAKVVKKFITARVKDTERKEAKQAEQLQLLFDEIPT